MDPMLRSSPKRRPGVRHGSCTHCGRSFRRKEHLERHLRTHTNEKPFKCICGASFSRRDLLTRHARLAHSESGVAAAGPRAEGDGQSSLADHNNVPAKPDPFIFYVPTAAAGQVQRAASLPPTRETALPSPAGQPSTQDLSGVLGEPEHATLPPDISDAFLQMSPDELYPFDEFTNFLDSIGLPAEWAPAGIEIASNPSVDTGVAQIVDQSSLDRDLEDAAQDDSPFHAWLPSVPPNAETIHSFNEMASYKPQEKVSPFRVDEKQRTRILTLLDGHRKTIPNFSLPSRHTLSRYLVAFFEGFHMHMLFFHIPTFRLTDHSPELILAIMAAGAQYRFEYRNASSFFHAARAIVSRRLQPYNVENQEVPMQGMIGTNEIPTLSPSQEIMIVRCLLILMGFATWQPPAMLREAFNLRNALITILRHSGLEEPTETLPLGTGSWAQWIELESSRRSKLSAFAFIDTYSIAYNHYPPIRNHEVKLRMPCQTRLWNAPTAAEWLAAMEAAGQEQLIYHDALSKLLSGSNSASSLSPMPSPLGNYYLLHGLIQRIHIIRELALDLGDASLDLPEDDLNRLETALVTWTHMWQQAPESSIDPANENGPIPFTSSSMLGLAYVRLSLNLGPFRQLETRDPARIALALAESPPVRRNGRMIPALIYAIHSFSIPVRLGVDYVARSQAFFWSVRHALASFECVILLSKWLFALATAREPKLSANERRILRWTTLIVEEAFDSMDVDENSSIPSSTPGDLALGVLEIWSRFFQHNSQWQFINILGESLAKYGAHLASLLTTASL
ncbi:hypothetical protein BJY01DRAFT_251321 [Aspergillus pseudoustus]|uniref:C2H2-type domain-containing protein n=1 Tax=Aspergillus pseudoustus TaxID=1810923 RepID=A0ABR4JCD5_9EURO